MVSSKREDRLVWSTVFAFFLSGFCSTVIGNFVPFLREAYGFDYKFAGILVSAASIGGLIAIVLSGILPIYVGRRISILFWTAWTAVGYCLLCQGVSAPMLLLLAFLGTGLSRGGNSNFSSTMMSTLPPERSPRGFLMIHSSFATGALLSPLVLVLLVTSGFTWKTMAGVLCGLGILHLLFYSKMAIPPMESKEKGKHAIHFGFLKDRYFTLGAVILLFYVSVEYGISGWLVTYFQDTGILSPEMAQLTNSLFWLVILTGRLVGSMVSKRFRPCQLLAIDALGMTVFFFLMFFSKTATSVLVGLSGVSFFMATMYPTAYSFGSTHLRGDDFGCSMLNLLPSAGGIIAPALVGFVAEKGGIQQGMGLLVLLTVVLMTVILITAWVMRPQKYLFKK